MEDFSIIIVVEDITNISDDLFPFLKTYNNIEYVLGEMWENLLRGNFKQFPTIILNEKYPYINLDQINNALRLAEKGMSWVVSVREVNTHPEYIMIDREGTLVYPYKQDPGSKSAKRRQDLHPVYEYFFGFFVCNKNKPFYRELEEGKVGYVFC